MNSAAKIIRIKGLMSLRITVLMVFMVLPMLVSATTIVGKYDLKRLANEAEAIIIGKCVEKTSYWKDGRIETRVEIEVSEYLKGDLGKKVTITQMGGQLSGPIPLVQYVTDTAQFVKGEEVVIFVRQPSQAKNKAITPSSKVKISPELRNSPQIVGLAQGKFTILTDEQTGEKRVFQARFDQMGFIPQDEVARKLYSLVLSTEKKPLTGQKAKITKQQVENILNQRPADSDQKSAPVKIKSTMKLPEKSALTSKELEKLRFAVPRFSSLPELEEFKAKIKNHLK